MGDPALERLLWRDRAIGSLAAPRGNDGTRLAVHLLSLARSMGAAPMPAHGPMDGMPGMETMSAHDGYDRHGDDACGRCRMDHERHWRW